RLEVLPAGDDVDAYARGREEEVDPGGDDGVEGGPLVPAHEADGGGQGDGGDQGRHPRRVAEAAEGPHGRARDAQHGPPSPAGDGLQPLPGVDGPGPAYEVHEGDVLVAIGVEEAPAQVDARLPGQILDGV